MSDKVFIVSPSPHVYGDHSINKLMYSVIIALIPAWAISIYFFGLGAFIVSVVSVGSAVLFEFLITKYMLKQTPTLRDGSAVITGLLLAFNVPSNLPIWIIIIGSLVSIGVGKMSFGGLGNNIFNPALVGRVFLLISFPVQMTSWPKPDVLSLTYTDAATGATYLSKLKEAGDASQVVEQLGYMNTFIGQEGGSIGEISAAALLIGGIYLLIRKVITWHIPVSMLGTIAVFTGILWIANPQQYADPLFHLLTGGILLGALFMATDYVTSPMSAKGMLIFGTGIGIITVLIRVFGAYPEGVSFAILIMNIFVPLINMYFKPKRFGEKKK